MILEKSRRLHRRVGAQQLYLVVVACAGIAAFAFLNKFNPFAQTLHQWVVLCLLAASVIVLNMFVVRLPAGGLVQSTDSAVFLAGMFAFGLGFVLYVLLLYSALFFFFERRINWLKRIANFSLYVLMIVAGYYVFIVFGGTVGALVMDKLYAYLLAMAAYYLINVVIIGMSCALKESAAVLSVLKGVAADTALSHANTLVLSVILTISLNNQSVPGMILYVGVLCVCVLLAAVSRQAYKLSGREQFEAKLDDELQSSREKKLPLSVAIVEIDGFAAYRDACGRVKADVLLDFFAAMLKVGCQKFGAQGQKNFIACYGQEQFAVLLAGVGANDALQLLRQLRAEVSNVEYEGREHFPLGCLSFSAGIAESGNDGCPKSRLLEEAEQALEYGKQRGGNVAHVYNPRSPVQKRLELYQEIRAIERQLQAIMGRCPDTFEHCRRVARYAVELSEHWRLDDQEKRMLVFSALCHDIGKKELPADLLHKNGQFTVNEWQIVKKHALWGRKIAASIPELKAYASVIEYHHEHYDGNGYPHGLKGEEIPKLARILSVIDAFDTMTTDRAYRRKRTVKEAIAEIRRCTGKQFDPEIADSFIRTIETGSVGLLRQI